VECFFRLGRPTLSLRLKDQSCWHHEKEVFGNIIVKSFDRVCTNRVDFHPVHRDFPRFGVSRSIVLCPVCLRLTHPTYSEDPAQRLFTSVKNKDIKTPFLLLKVSNDYNPNTELGLN